MSGDAKELASLLGASKDRGRWWVASDQLCYKWFRWFDAEPRCLAIRQEAKQLFWQRDDGESGTATIMEQGKPPPKPKLQVAIAAQIPRVQVKATHPADVKANATTALNALAHTVQTREDAQVQLSSRPTSISTKTQSPPKSPISVLSVPAPRPAVRPKPHLVAATQPRSTELRTRWRTLKRSRSGLRASTRPTSSMSAMDLQKMTTPSAKFHRRLAGSRSSVAVWTTGARSSTATLPAGSTDITSRKRFRAKVSFGNA